MNTKINISLDPYGRVIIDDKELLSEIYGSLSHDEHNVGHDANCGNKFCGHDLACVDSACSTDNRH